RPGHVFRHRRQQSRVHLSGSGPTARRPRPNRPTRSSTGFSRPWASPAPDGTYHHLPVVVRGRGSAAGIEHETNGLVLVLLGEVSACRHASTSAAISGSLRPGVYKIGNGP